MRLIDFYDNKDRKWFSLVKGVGKDHAIVHTWLASGPVGVCKKCPWKSKEDLPPISQFNDYVRHMYQSHKTRIKQ